MMAAGPSSETNVSAVRPPIGNKCSHEPKTRIKTNPNQKMGIALTMTDKIRPILSNHDPCRTADQMPIGMPNDRPNSKASPVNSTVAGTRCTIKSETFTLEVKESPQSPCTKRVNHWTY